MRTITEPHDAQAAILDILERKGPRSAGNLTRDFMGVGLLPDEQESYVLVAEALAMLHRRGRVEKHGNGKSIHWRLTPRGAQ